MSEAAAQLDVGGGGSPAPRLDPAMRVGPASGAEIAIIGLGAWGLCVLERVVGTARLAAHRGLAAVIRVHVIEPNRPGVGVYSVTEPDYFLLNTPCGQVSLQAWQDESARGGPCVGLHEWVTRRGYRWVGDVCRVDPCGRPISPDDYLPRRLMGEYLEWFFRELVAAAPPHVAITHHSTVAIDVRRESAGGERVVLANGGELVVDRVVLTSGHTANLERPDGVAVPPYPVSTYADRVAAGTPVVVAGMGLVAADVVAAMTVGRGGAFRPRGDRLRYVPSGQEPLIQLFSRGGVPHCAKAVGAPDATDEFEPGIFTPEAVAGLRLRSASGGGSARLDARRDVLPLLGEEMQLRYYEQAARLGGGEAAGQRARRQLVAAHRAGAMAAAVQQMEQRHGRFEPLEHLFPADGRTFAGRADYEAFVYGMVEQDLREAMVPGGASPTKAAYEVLRFLRDPVRRVIEFGGLAADSHLDFFANVRGRMTRLVAGPPAVRSQQLLALMDAGVVQAPFGPSPEVTVGRDGADVRSTRLARPHAGRVGIVVRGYFEDPAVDRSASELLTRLHGRGRLQQLSRDGRSLGSVELTPDFHPVNAWGEPEPTLFVFGAVTEGVRYFTHYVPSPKSRLRAVIDAQACAEEMLG